MALKLPKIIGHRGACGYAPENTIESIQTAAEMGVEWVELDIKLTRDEIPVIFHDETLERTTNGSGKMAETDYEDLQQLEAGSWFADSFSGIKIPTLEESVEILIKRGLGLNLNITPCPGREKETAEIALDTLSRIWDDHENLLIVSKQHVSLETARDIAGDWHRGMTLDMTGEEWKDMAVYLDLSVISVESNECTRENIEEIIDFDKAIMAYTANDPARANILQSWGVDSFLTDTPDVIRENLLTLH